MARHAMTPIVPLHPDGAQCTHRSPRGFTPPPDCPGRTQYRAACSCGWADTARYAVSVRAARAAHRDAVLSRAPRAAR